MKKMSFTLFLFVLLFHGLSDYVLFPASSKLSKIVFRYEWSGGVIVEILSGFICSYLSCEN